MKKLLIVSLVVVLCLGSLYAADMFGYELRSPFVRKESKSRVVDVDHGFVSAHGVWVFEPKAIMVEASGGFYPCAITPNLKVVSSIDIGYLGEFERGDAKLVNGFSLGFTAGVGFISSSFEASLRLAYSHSFGMYGGNPVNTDHVSPVITLSYINSSNGFMIGAIYKHWGFGARIGLAF